MEDIKRIYTLLSRSNGLKIRDIATELGLDKIQLAELLFSEECSKYWYQNDSSLWFPKDGALTVEADKQEDKLAKQIKSVTGYNAEKYIYTESDEGLRFYLKQVLSFPTYSYIETNQLFERYRVDDDTNAFEMIVKGHLKLVVNIARKYRHKGVPFRDLIQEGNYGLLIAVEQYDYTYNKSFIEYAKKSIFQSIGNALQTLPFSMKIPFSAISRHWKVRKHLERLEQQYEFEPLLSEEDLESIIGTKDASVYKCLPHDLLTIDVHVDDMDSFESDSFLTDAPLMQESQRQYIRSLTSLLDKRCEDIIVKYFGIGCEDMTLEEIGKHHNLTRERIRQILWKGIRTLRKVLGVYRKKQKHEEGEEIEEQDEESVSEIIERLKKRRHDSINKLAELIVKANHQKAILKPKVKPSSQTITKQSETKVKKGKRSGRIITLSDADEKRLQEHLSLIRKECAELEESRKKKMQEEEDKLHSQISKPVADSTIQKRAGEATAPPPTIISPYTQLRKLVELNILTQSELEQCITKGFRRIIDVKEDIDTINKFGLAKQPSRHTKFTLSIWFKIVDLLGKEIRG